MPTNNACVCIRAQICICGVEYVCDRDFADKRNQFRGVFDIRDIMSNRHGKWDAGTTTYTFFCDCLHDDAPNVLNFLRDAGFEAMYWPR